MLDLKLNLDMGKMINALNGIVKQWREGHKAAINEEMKSAIPTIIRDFLALADQNGQLASLLKQSSISKTPMNVAQAEKKVENIRIIITHIKKTIDRIDPDWVAAHVDLFKTIDSLSLEKELFADTLLQEIAATERMTQIGNSLRQKANKLTKAAKSLSSVHLSDPQSATDA
jgi:hypothetical protein